MMIINNNNNNNNNNKWDASKKYCLWQNMMYSD